jgi:hypothetical protein
MADQDVVAVGVEGCRRLTYGLPYYQYRMVELRLLTLLASKLLLIGRIDLAILLCC